MKRNETGLTALALVRSTYDRDRTPRELVISDRSMATLELVQRRQTRGDLTNQIGLIACPGFGQDPLGIPARRFVRVTEARRDFPGALPSPEQESDARLAAGQSKESL